MATRFMNGFNNSISAAARPSALKLTLEMLDVQQLDLAVTVPQVVIFHDAIIDLLILKMGAWFISKAIHDFSALLNYFGGAYTYIWREFVVHIRIINASSEFPADRILVVPNGINMETFKPQPKALPQVLKEQLIDSPILWPTKPTEETLGGYKKMITFVGKFAEWKRQAALHIACAELEKDFPDFCALFVGAGPDEERDKLIACCEKLGVKNSYLCGARGQPVLAEIYTVADLGCFPSFKEPFGLVFVECMACKTPVIGANSGGPKDFVSEPVGCLCDEPPETTSLDTVPAGIETLAKSLKEAIAKALTENWKQTKGEACLQLAIDRFTVKSQVTKMFEMVKGLPEV